MKEKLRKCTLCGKKFRIIQTAGRNSVKGSSKLKWDSKDGIFFHFNENHSSGTGGKWFCNECWEQLIATSSDSATQVVNDGLNISLKTTPLAPSKLPSATSLNNN